jgi:hypothetical protein
MICPECSVEGRKSKVYPGLSTVTLMASAPYYDEDGEYHDHDPNITTTRFACSNGHDWQEKKGPAECPVCLRKESGMFPEDAND